MARNRQILGYYELRVVLSDVFFVAPENVAKSTVIGEVYLSYIYAEYRIWCLKLPMTCPKPCQHY